MLPVTPFFLPSLQKTRQMGYELVDIQNRLGSCFFIMMHLNMFAITASIVIFNQNADLVIKELEAGLYKVETSFLVTFFVNLPVNLTLNLFQGLAVFFIGNMNFHSWENLAVFIMIW
jgi:hypothetical protein